MIDIANRLCLLVRYALLPVVAWLSIAATSAGWAAASRLLRNINTNIVPESSTPGFLGTINGKMLFAATDGTGPGLWSTDGTSSATVLLRRIPVFPQIVYPGQPEFVVIGSLGYFVVFGPTQGAQIWSTDGTAAGTTLVADMGTAPGGGHIPVLFGAFGSKLIFSADDTTGTQQLFATNGSSPGVQMLTHLPSTTLGVNNTFAATGSKLYFATYGPDAGGIYNGTIWVSDGTTAGTHAVTNPYGINTSVGMDAEHYVQSMTLVGNEVLYCSAGLLWSVDTSTDTISAVTVGGGQVGFGPPTGANQLIDMGGYVAFLGAGGVWRSDGTSAGTYSVAPAASVQNPLLQRVGNRVIFYGTDAQNNVQVMSSDLTAGNIVQLTTGTQPSNAAFPRAPYYGTVAGIV